jgi:DNA mismatch endonuclease (patch repair protein)
MQSNRPRDTKPEVALRSALHRSGMRFRKHLRPVANLRCEPDAVFTRARLAVFLDGCWWHSCPEHGSLPVRNGDWWARKLAVTRERDRRNTAALEAAGWRVLRVWEHEQLNVAVERVRAALTLASPGSNMLRR